MDIVPQLIVNSIIAGATYTLVALGFNLIFSTVKFFDLGYGALTAVGGYAVFLLFKILGLPLLLSVLLGIFAAGLIGVLINALVYKPMRARGSSNMVLLVASLGVLTMLQAFLAIAFTSQFQTIAPQVGGASTYTILGGTITYTQLIIVALSILVTAGLVGLLNYTKFGKAVKAIGDDEEVAKIVGINTPKIIMWVFFIGSAIGGLSGIMVGFDTGIEPTMGLALLLKGVIAAIIGGIGNVYGGFVGAYVLGFVENFGIWHISGEWKDAIAFLLLILFLLFKPEGILRRK